MISLIGKSIAHSLYKRKIISDEEVPVCEYGFELIVSIVIGFFLVAMSGILLDEFVASMIFYGLFVSVRTFTGGYHAQSHLACKSTMVICCLFVLVGSKISERFENPFWLNILCLIFYLITVFLYAPVEHVNAPMTDKLKVRNRKISIIMAAALTLADIAVFIYFRKVAVILSLTLFVVALLIIIPKVQERRKERYEKIC